MNEERGLKVLAFQRKSLSWYSPAEALRSPTNDNTDTGLLEGWSGMINLVGLGMLIVLK